MWYRTLSPTLSLISFHILFPVSYHPPSMLLWSISYRNFVLIIWRQICLSVSHLCVQLWLCKSWHIDIKWYRPSLYNLPLRVWHCSRWVINEWLVAGQLLMSYFRPHYSGLFRRLPCWETRWIYSKCKAFICLYLSNLVLTVTLSVWALGSYCRSRPNSPWVMFCSVLFLQDKCAGVCGMDQMDKLLLLFLPWAPSV